MVRAARLPSMCGPVSYPSIDTICDLSLLSGSFLYSERFFSGNFEFSLSSKTNQNFRSGRGSLLNVLSLNGYLFYY